MNREILRLAIPNILSNLSVPLLGLVDAALMGHMDEAEKFLSAIAIAAAIFNVLYISFAFLRMGTTGMTAQAFGASKNQESLLVLLRGLGVAMVFGLLIMAVQSPVAWIGLELMEGSPDAKGIASDYFFIRIYAAPAALTLFVFNGWFLGMQNAVIPLILSLVINVVNIGANYLFVIEYNMGAEGIAYGTVLAQYSGLFSAIVLFFVRYRYILNFRKGSKLLNGKQLRHFFVINRDLFVRTACIVLTFSYFTAKSGSFGDEVLAANALLIQLLYLMSYLVDGFAFAAESLVGKYVGLRNTDILKVVIRKILIFGMSFGALFSLFYLFAGRQFLELLSNDPGVVDDAMTYLPWMVLMPIWGTYAFMWDGIFIGATASKTLRNIVLISTFFIFLPTWWISRDFLGNHGLWLALSLFMIVRGIGFTLKSKQITNISS